MKYESYSDRLARLYPETASAIEVGGNFTRDITIQVTEDCNMRCTYCYQHDKTPARLDVETGKKFIDLILASDERTEKYIRSRECQGVILNFIGGEPFLEIDTISELTDYFITRMIELDHPWLTMYRIGISSNGLLYFDPRVQEYLRKNCEHLSLTITVDGNKTLHDMCRIDAAGNPTYDRVVAAARDYETRYHMDNGTKVTLSPDNLKYLSEALIQFIDEGEDQINVNCVYEEGWTVDHARAMYLHLKTVADYLLDRGIEEDVRVSILDDIAGVPYTNTSPWCGGTGLMMAMDVRGDIYPCLRYTPSSVGPNVVPFKIGDVEHGFIYNEEQAERLRCMACVTRKSQCAGTDCEDCPIASGCGDCAGYTYERTGTINARTTYICDMHKARCLAQVYYKNKAYLLHGRKEPLAMNTPKDWAVPIIGEEEYEKLSRLADEAAERYDVMHGTSRRGIYAEIS